jgi:HSP20 family protein
MMLTRYESYNLIDRFHDEINRLFNTSPGSSAAPPTSWAPVVDILEDELRYVLRVDVPGVERKDIDITLEDTVSPSRVNAARTRGRQAGYRRHERAMEFFRRSPARFRRYRRYQCGNDGVLEVEFETGETGSEKITWTDVSHVGGFPVIRPNLSAQCAAPR